MIGRALTIAFVALVLLVMADSHAQEQQKKPTAKTTPLVYTDGSPALRDEVCLAEQKQKDGTVVIYRKTDADIEKLLADIKSDPVASKKKELATREFWTAASACDRTAGNKCSTGTCSKGSCKQVTSGRFTYCRCS